MSLLIDVFTIAVSNGNKSPIHSFNNHVGTRSEEHDELLHDNNNTCISSEIAVLKFISFISISMSSCVSDYTVQISSNDFNFVMKEIVEIISK